MSPKASITGVMLSACVVMCTQHDAQHHTPALPASAHNAAQCLVANVWLYDHALKKVMPVRPQSSVSIHCVCAGCGADVSVLHVV